MSGAAPPTVASTGTSAGMSSGSSRGTSTRSRRTAVNTNIRHENTTNNSSASSSSVSGNPATMMALSSSSTTLASETPIWATRTVEWPLPTKIPGPVYQKLVRQSQQQMQMNYPMGISGSGGGVGLFSKAMTSSSSSAGGGGGGAGVMLSSTLSSSRPTDNTSGNLGNDGTPAILTGFMNRVLGPTTATTTNTNNIPTTMGGFIGNNNDPKSALLLSSGGATTTTGPHGGIVSDAYVRPPRKGCVASANGWIVAAVECTTTATSTTGSNPMNTIHNNSNNNNNNNNNNEAGVGGTNLRLISRWNVRRASMSDQWIALPPPSTPQVDCRICHVFVDPTASHIFVSAANGEAYYIHSSSSTNTSSSSSNNNATGSSGINSTNHLTTPGFSQQQQLSGFSTNSRQVIKLSGFGRANTRPEWLTGVSATSVPGNTSTAAAAATGVSSSSSSSPGYSTSIQVGLSLNTYVTAVAWDRERDTEGSTKKILLGTSGGEIYEYSLNTAGNNSNSTAASTSSNEEKTDDNYSNISAQQPVLLHKLYNNNNTTSMVQYGNNNNNIGSGGTSSSTTLDPREVGAAVSGLYFERLRTGLLVLIATSGKYKRTRFYTFYSPHSSSFRMVLGDQQNHHFATLQELPGSIDCADLRLCNDYFALRTATGIYYGTIDRSLSGPAGLAGGNSMIVDSGILPYDVLLKEPQLHQSLPISSKQQLPYTQNGGVPVSIALTPHHIVTLSDSSEVCFVNRVAQKVIQRERIHEFLHSSSPSHEQYNNHNNNNNEVPSIFIGELMICNILHTVSLAQQYPTIFTASIHPGLVRTDVVRNMPLFMFLQKEPSQGAWCTVDVAALIMDCSPANSGKYWLRSIRLKWYI